MERQSSTFRESSKVISEIDIIIFGLREDNFALTGEAVARNGVCQREKEGRKFSTSENLYAP